MASTLKYVRVPPNSANLEEARRRVFDLFKTACRSIPTIMEIYVLDEVVTPTQIRSTIASVFRKNAHVTNPKRGMGNALISGAKVIDMLLFKGMEELNNIVEHSKQRHHIIGQYVLPYQELIQDIGTKDLGASDFLKGFYKSNY